MAKYYAVKIGRKEGIFSSWDECKEQVHGYPGAVYKSFSTLEEAENFLGDIGEVADMPVFRSSHHESLEVYKVVIQRKH